MRFPPETALALTPPVRRAGGVALRPLTLRGAAEIDRRGIDLARNVPAALVPSVAQVLAGAAEGDEAFIRRASAETGLCRAVEAVLNDAFATYLKPPPDKNRVPGPPTGFGWPLEVSEFLCGEYGWPLAAALDCPVATAFAFMAAHRQRHGLRHGEPDYVEKIAIAEWKAKKKE